VANIKDKKMDVFLSKTIDNRLVILEGDEMLLVLWVVHQENQKLIKINDCQKPNLKFKMKEFKSKQTTTRNTNPVI
jgi:hypothetical protein